MNRILIISFEPQNLNNYERFKIIKFDKSPGQDYAITANNANNMENGVNIKDMVVATPFIL